jgi:hypothetical protein
MSLFISTPDYTKAPIEEDAVLPIAVTGVVAGVAYTLQWIVLADRNPTPLYQSFQHFHMTEQLDETPTAVSIPGGSIRIEGVTEVRMAVIDRGNTTTAEQTSSRPLLTFSRRRIEFWSKGCTCSILWPPRKAELLDDAGQELEQPCEQREIVKGGKITLSTTASLDRIASVLTIAAVWKGQVSVCLYARTNVELDVMRRLVREKLSLWLLRRGRVRIVLVSPCYGELLVSVNIGMHRLALASTRTHACTHARTHARTYVRTHARTIH